VQARKHLESIPLVRPFTSVLIAGHTPDRTRRFVDEAGPTAPCPITAADTVEDAVRAADVVVTVTDSHTPILLREWLRPGTHVNAVGASRPMHWEIDPRIYADALAVCDRRESLCAEAGDYLRAVADRLIAGAEQIGELGELIVGKRKGRTTSDQITLFRSLGLAVEDLAAAEFVVEKAASRSA